MKTFKEALASRRSYYLISNFSPISDNEIENILKFALQNVPSAFNSQSTRIVLLLGENHSQLWNIVKSTLKKIVPEDIFPKTEAKINNCFACGYGTVLFFEDKMVIENLQKTFPSYSENFPTWSEQTNAMHQLCVWTMLEDAGFGASLQHYNPLIDNEVKENWNINQNWKLIAQMPFGTPSAQPDKKEYLAIEERLFIFK